MKKTTAALALVVVLLLSAAVWTQSKNFAFAQTMSVTINNDGSVSPSTAPIQQTGNTYTLTSSINGRISVNKNNIILAGNAMTLSGGLLLNGVSNVTVENFTIEGGEQIGETPRGLFAGIYLGDTSNAVIANNTITEVSNFLATFEYYETVAGIIVTGGGSNIFSGNNLVDNFQGMEFENTAHNLIVENNVTYSSAAEKAQGYHDPAGIFFDRASNNTVYHNNFEISIDGQAGDSYNDSVNTWDNGYPAGGNYWINYNAQEIGSSGIGNIPYEIDANNIDRYPLMEPFNSTFFVLQTTLPKIVIQSPANQTYHNSSIPLVFFVDVFSADKAVNWSGYSLDGRPNETIISNNLLTNATIVNATKGLHCITVYANDTFGNMGVSQTINFTVAAPEPFPVAPVAAAVAVVAVAVGAGLLVYLKKRKH
jgi:hypothetical protein